MSHAVKLVVTLAMLAALALTAAGCSSAGDKYLGKWKAVEGGKAGDYVEITRQGSDYGLSLGNASGSSPGGTLTEEGGKLVQKGPDGKLVTEMTFDPATNHLKWQMGGIMTMELQRQ